MSRKQWSLPALMLIFLLPVFAVAVTAATIFFVNNPAILSDGRLAAQSLPNPEHVFLTGRAAFEAEQYGLAEARFRAALAQDFNRPNWHNGLGLALAKQGRFDESVAAYETALSFDSKNAIFNYNLALAYRDNDEVDRSVTMFKRVMALAPDTDVATSARRALRQLSTSDNK